MRLSLGKISVRRLSGEQQQPSWSASGREAASGERFRQPSADWAAEGGEGGGDAEAVREGSEVKPLCKLCRTRHWVYEPHDFGDRTAPTVTVTPSAPESVTVTPPLNDSSVTVTVGKATPVPKINEVWERVVGRRRRVDAERQRAYRGRSRGDAA